MRLPLPVVRVRRAGRALLLVVAGLLVAGCQVRSELNLTVREDGSGVVELAVALDEDAMSRRPTALEDLDLSDLRDAGWEIAGPEEEVDGWTWLRARHDFGTPEELGTLVDEIGGEQGPLRDFELRREDAFAESRYDFSGTVDFTAGAASLAQDPELAEALEAEPIALLEERLGAAIDEMVQVQVAVRLPGSVESNAPTRASNGAAWQPSVVERERVELAATGTVSRSERLVWVGVAVAAGFALLLYLLVRFALWRRRRRDEAPAAP